MKRHLSFASTVLAFISPLYLSAQGYTCETAAAVTGGVVYTVDTLWGDDEGFEYGCYPPAVNDALWYVYTAPFTGTVEVTSCSPITTMNTRVSIFTGDCSDPECYAWNDDGNCPWVPTWLSSRVSFDVVAGEHYYIQWDNEWLPTSTINFQWIINSCEVRVEGTVYRDLNSNAVHDEGEPLYPGILDRDGQQQYTYAHTDPYLICSTTGEHTITLTNPPLYHNVVPPVRTYTSNNVGYVDSMDFALQPIPGMYDGSVSIWGVTPWIGNNTIMQVDYENIGTEPINATVELHLDPLLQFASSPVAGAVVNGPVITWDLGVIPVGAHGTIPVVVYTPPTVEWGYETTNWVVLQVTENDVDGSNNFDETKLPTVASWDPNDKQVDAMRLHPDSVTAQQMLGYTIRFQNTGDAPAVNVVVRDTLDENLDMSTFDMISATHPFVLSMEGRVVSWTFPNIMLPDSTTDAEGSIGAFHYRIAANTDLMLGDQVQNEAHIFFDFAPAIVTNTVTTTVALPTGLGEDDASINGLLIWPSPGNGKIMLRLSGEAIGTTELAVLDVMGRIVHRERLASLHPGQELQLDLTALPAGNYVADLRGAEELLRARFIIQR
jgi:uncharacterized repeat protein (TIGR01451 family)